MALYPLIRPLLFALDAERAHSLAIASLKRRAPLATRPKTNTPLGTRVAGLDFPNPVGLAPGFDKNAEVFGQILGLGFGFAEIGTVTPVAQDGNPRPRLFRLREDRAVINRMGFNNVGHAVAARRLAACGRAGIVGANVGANKDSADRIADYVEGVRNLGPLADYLTINISSPNTPGLRGLQDKAALDALLGAIAAARQPSGPPIFLKVAPDLEPRDVDNIAEAALTHKLDALIVGNTTVSRPALQSRHQLSDTGRAGGASFTPAAGRRRSRGEPAAAVA